jgi:predicted molibdopterin-dependent oxidoreductase YjgC
MQINGIEVSFAEGDTILDAARRSRIPIPTLCFDPRVSPSGACRLCLVAVEGASRPVPACSFPAADGLEVQTESEELRELRRCILELTLSENPQGECARCRDVGPCELHRLAGEYGARQARFRGGPSGARVADDHPLVGRDPGLCIACNRCVRVCNELEQAHAIAMGGRGFGSHVTTLFGRRLEAAGCTSCGQCINTCPTGALFDRSRSPAATAADIETRVRTVCPYCGTGCGVVLDVAEDRIVGARGDFDSPVSHGSLCVKGQFGWHFVHSDERLTEPLVRRGRNLERASWDEALDLVAERFTAIKRERGPDALVFWSSSRATNEANYVFQRLARAVVGTNNVDNCART